MSEESVVVTAPSVDEAVIIGLTRLAATRDEVDIRNSRRGKSWYFWVGGARSPRSVDATPASLLTEKVSPMHEPVSAVVTVPEPEPIVETPAPQPEAPVV